MDLKLGCATAVCAVLGASSPAYATFVLDTSCGEASCAAGSDFFIDAANKGATTFVGTVGGHSGPAVTVTTTESVDTGAGFATIKPVKGGLLPDLIFTPADDTLFNDFSFRGQLLDVPSTGGVVDVKWTDSVGMSGTIAFTGVPGPDADFGRLGIVSTDGETLKSVEITTPGSESFKQFKQVQFSFATSPVPESSTWALMLLGFAGLGYAGLRKRRTEARLAVW